MPEGNSYTNLLKLMKLQGYNKDVKVVVGKVKSVSPLEIDMGKYVITEDDMIITETIKNMITGNIGDALNIYTTTKLKNNDKVLVIIDEVDFYVIDRVV